MLTTNQSQLISNIARDLIERNVVRHHAAIRMYRSIEQMPQNVRYEHDQRSAETDALRALAEHIGKITAPAA